MLGHKTGISGTKTVSHLFRYEVPHLQSRYNVRSVHIPKNNVFTDVLYIIVYKGLNYPAVMESLVGLMATSAGCFLDICGKTLSPGADRLSIISTTADFGFPQARSAASWSLSL